MSQFTLFFAPVLSSIQSAWAAIPVFTTIASPIIVKSAVLIAFLMSAYVVYYGAPKALPVIIDAIVDTISKIGAGIKILSNWISQKLGAFKTWSMNLFRSQSPSSTSAPAVTDAAVTDAAEAEAAAARVAQEAAAAAATAEAAAAEAARVAQEAAAAAVTDAAATAEAAAAEAARLAQETEAESARLAQEAEAEAKAARVEEAAAAEAEAAAAEAARLAQEAAAAEAANHQGQGAAEDKNAPEPNMGSNSPDLNTLIAAIMEKVTQKPNETLTEQIKALKALKATVGSVQTQVGTIAASPVDSVQNLGVMLCDAACTVLQETKSSAQERAQKIDIRSLMNTILHRTRAAIITYMPKAPIPLDDSYVAVHQTGPNASDLEFRSEGYIEILQQEFDALTFRSTGAGAPPQDPASDFQLSESGNGFVI